jgi:type IX secretion system PorP/SprF family membrane protein
MRTSTKAFLLVLILSNKLQSQQIVSFNHAFFKPMIINPAYTAVDNAPNLMIINRTQWTGFKGGPQYNVLSFDGNAFNKNTGLGIILTSDKKGLNSRIGGSFLYSYKLKFKNRIFLKLGLAAGAVNQNFNYSNAVIENTNDASLFNNNQSSTTFDSNFGLTFLCKNLEFGVSAPQLAGNSFSYKSTSDKQILYTQNRHYMSTLKYNLILKKEITISPFALVRYLPNAPLQYDANLNVNFKNKFWIGGTYKNDYAISINLGFTLFKHLSIGYSYDYITGSLNKYAGLSHEILLNYRFFKPKKEAVVNTDSINNAKTQADLNKLIIQRILDKIDALLEKDNVPPQEITDLMNEISSFFDNDSDDPFQKTIQKYYASLKKQAKGEINVLLKGSIILKGSEDNPNYSNVFISINDFITNELIATSSARPRDGKYFFILNPGRKYKITVENEGYPTFIKEFTASSSGESYEVNQEIILKKVK